MVSFSRNSEYSARTSESTYNSIATEPWRLYNRALRQRLVALFLSLSLFLSLPLSLCPSLVFSQFNSVKIRMKSSKNKSQLGDGLLGEVTVSSSRDSSCRRGTLHWRLFSGDFSVEIANYICRTFQLSSCEWLVCEEFRPEENLDLPRL